MDQEIVDTGLNIIIQRGDLEWRPALRNIYIKKHMYIAAVQIARLRIVMLDDTVLSLKSSCQVLIKYEPQITQKMF